MAVNMFKMNENHEEINLIGTSIRPNMETFYRFALMSGEGIGTAYEYFVKWGLLKNVIDSAKDPKHIFIWGLPEKYGLGLDFVLLAMIYRSSITIVDERHAIIDKFKIISDKIGHRPQIDISRIENLSQLDAKSFLEKNHGEKYDLLLSCEVLQRLSEGDRANYFNQIGKIAKVSAIFVPNKDNVAHAKLSGLNTVSLCELQSYCSQTSNDILKSGYVDMPPFPPGLRRSEDAKNKALDSRVERFLMRILEKWELIEKITPFKIKAHLSHIVYVFTESYI